MQKKNQTLVIILILSSVYFISQFCRVSLGVVAVDITNDINLESNEDESIAVFGDDLDVPAYLRNRNAD